MVIVLVVSFGEIDINDKFVFFMLIDNVWFWCLVVLGDILEILIEIVKVCKFVWKFYGEVYVNGEFVV